MGHPEQYADIELNPPASGLTLDMDCQGGNHGACVGPPGTRCECSCHVTEGLRQVLGEARDQVTGADAEIIRLHDVIATLIRERDEAREALAGDQMSR